MPLGNSSQRPAAPSAGMIRTNTQISQVELYNGAQWGPILPRDNVFPSPTDIYAWAGNVGNNNCTISRDTTVSSPFANNALKMAVTGNDPYIGTYSAARWKIAPAATGQTWQITVSCRASVATTMQIFIFGATPSGSWNSQSGTIEAFTHSVTTSWAQYSLFYTFSNPTVSYVQLRLDGPDSGGAGQNLWFDGLVVRRSG
jgi:hypothetical protein